MKEEKMTRARWMMVFLLLSSLAAGLAQTGGYGFSQLLTLRGAYSSVLYAPGSLDRAAHVQARLDNLTLQVRDWCSQPLSFTAYVLTREDWEKGRLNRPYGLPVMGMGVTLLLPARGDEETVDLWRGLIKGPLPAPPDMPMVGTPQEAASLLLADLVSVPELMRGLTHHMGIAPAEPWIAHTVAHLTTYLYATRREKPLIPQMDTFYHYIGRGSPLPLEAFRADLPPEQLYWYEARFYEAAKLIFEKDRRWSVRKLRSIQKKGGGQLTAAGLLGRYDALAGWHQQGFLHSQVEGDPSSGR
jgi:hypothetical protein